jgi:hypothetical protein
VDCIHGGCHCGQIQLFAELAQVPGAYPPRACDCDFCRKHGAAYISDPAGKLRIQLSSQSAVSRYRQGSGTAQFLVCTNCGVLVAVLHRTGATTYGAINANAISGPTAFAPAKSVSPKTLSPTEKVQRWQNVWFADVEVSYGS